MKVTTQINEKLDYISLGKTLDEQIERAKVVGKNDPSFPVLMRMAFTENEKILGLPEGTPDTYKPDTAIPDGIAETTVRQELRRIRNFIKNGSMHKISPMQRETIWIQILEGLHWKEAAIMTQIKDQTLQNSYPNLIDILLKLGVPVSDSFRAKENNKKTTNSKKTTQKDV